MKKAFLKLMCILTQLLWRLRYKVSYKGLEKVKAQLKEGKNGTIFLPNHPAIFIDPLLVTIPLLQSFSVRPLIVEYMFYHPLVNWAARIIQALPIPNFHTGFNIIKERRTKRMLGKISEGLKQNQNFLVYPSGATKQGPKEVLGGTFGVHQLISENQEMTIVLVRTTGLWGSIFSRALTHGDVPDMNKALQRAFWMILKNAIFFMPRRKVTVEFEVVGKEFPRKASKQEINRYLEDWYNKPFESIDHKENFGEPLSLVSYAFWKTELPQIADALEERFELSSVPEVIKDQILTKLSELTKRPKDQIQPSQKLLADLSLDSLDLSEIVVFLEAHYDVVAINPGDLTTVSRLFMIAMKTYQKPEARETEWNLKRWEKNPSFERAHIPDGDTIPEVFLRICDQKLFDVACADSRAGVMSYRKVKMKALLLSEKIKNIPGDRIGILLPSSVTCQILILACMFAGKTPVMINWTVGGRHLDTVVDVSKIQVVLTSWGFLDNLENVDISRIEEMLYMLEEMKLEISAINILKAGWESFLSSSRLLSKAKFLHLQQKNGKKEAVILFTSGSEAMPKGVPLSHKNLLMNERAVLEAIEISSQDRIIATLPPFHSFGFAVTGLMPLLAGIKVVYYPSPTDSKRIAKAIKKWGVTILASAPTFLKNILAVSDREQLSLLRLIAAGAEKSPQELYDLALKLCSHAKVVEGYGITECSPVLTFNVESLRESGVGSPIPGVQLKIVDPETHQPIPDGQVGLILAAGPNIFKGYLNEGIQSPFLEMGGSRWYITGDLGKLDDNGNLLLAGRLKRFVKIGGEMISLAAVEEAVSQHINEITKKIPELPQVALRAGTEGDGKPKLTLFSCHPFEANELNQLLRQKGFSSLVKIDKVCKVDAIPVTATGKIAYRQLEKMMDEYAAV
ncbi:MAG: aas [Chlamydiia bacterium]|nr:aas [Chlamydiia bacterium]